jgi:hypothetical protein
MLKTVEHRVNEANPESGGFWDAYIVLPVDTPIELAFL